MDLGPRDRRLREVRPWQGPVDGLGRMVRQLGSDPAPIVRIGQTHRILTGRHRQSPAVPRDPDALLEVSSQLRHHVLPRSRMDRRSPIGNHASKRTMRVSVTVAHSIGASQADVASEHPRLDASHRILVWGRGLAQTIVLR